MDIVTKLIAIAQVDYALAKHAGIEYTLTTEALAIKEIIDLREKVAQLTTQLASQGEPVADAYAHPDFKYFMSLKNGQATIVANKTGVHSQPIFLHPPIQPSAPVDDFDVCACPEHGSWIAAEDYYRNVKALDVALNGLGGAERPSLTDILSQVEAIVRERGKPLLESAPVDERGEFIKLYAEKFSIDTDDFRFDIDHEGDFSHTAVYNAYQGWSLTRAKLNGADDGS